MICFDFVIIIFVEIYCTRMLNHTKLITHFNYVILSQKVSHQSIPRAFALFDESDWMTIYRIRA